ncbi:hypothetical protein PZH32_08125 [Adlercreutzia equolifaciens]|uniref:hypothetical protein n=1 Tax=Adlercreutzia equolifaciens TaxID=446660 RepID=UPI0023B0AFB2|nr:hypothetical protein [Adlercreutzia equolifaciens]MDE8702930.1 hypothetical protein [Adlercreutzia equolifaciens]
MSYTEKELNEALRQIDSTLHKLRETKKTLEAKDEPARYKSQITLATRRIEAFGIARDLIAREMEQTNESEMA